jgi:hypothetical protein
MSFVVPSPLGCGPNALAIGRTFFTIATPDSHAAGQAISAAKEEFQRLFNKILSLAKGFRTIAVESNVIGAPQCTVTAYYISSCEEPNR